jgi:hypothetical protein
LKFPKFYLGKMIEEKQRNEGILRTNILLMGYLRWGQGDNATALERSGSAFRSLEVLIRTRAH